MNKGSSQQKLIDAASLLFFRNGYHNTTVRDIASKASVNISLINYYFDSKQGLFEYIITHYYEEYLKEIETTINDGEQLSPVNLLKEVVLTVVNYKHTHYRTSCFIHRELALDSIFIREMSVTYIAKENYFINQILFNTAVSPPFNEEERYFLLMQFKGMLVAPYILHNEWKHDLTTEYSHNYYVNTYVQGIYKWLDIILLKRQTS